jgi:uncharacterized protein
MQRTDSIFVALEREARRRAPTADPAHDFSHVERVTAAASIIAVAEGADTDIVLPAALFHDIVIYPKDYPRSKDATWESARIATEILTAHVDRTPCFPSEKIARVATCIAECSFSKGIRPESIEGKVLQDADLLEASGFVAIMRTFASCGQMKHRFYETRDPFCSTREPVLRGAGIDLFYSRLLTVPDRLHTQSAKRLVKRRHQFLLSALEELRLELEELSLL